MSSTSHDHTQKGDFDLKQVKAFNKQKFSNVSSSEQVKFSTEEINEKGGKKEATTEENAIT